MKQLLPIILLTATSSYGFAQEQLDNTKELELEFNFVALQAEQSHVAAGLGLVINSPSFLPEIIVIGRVGVSENLKTQNDREVESDHFLASTLGIALSAPVSEQIKSYAELSVGADGIGLKSSDNKNGTHLISRSIIGLRLDAQNSYLFFGTGIQARGLADNKPLAGGRPLSRYTVIPTLGLGIRF